MRPTGSPMALERRRQRAIALLERGMSLKEVAHRVGASFSSVFRWQQAVVRDGPGAVKAKPVPGRPRKLPEGECRQLLTLLLKGALAYGFPNELWTLKRIAKVIRNEFGMVYHPNHLWRLLRRAGWSCQVPERRAIQRDEEAITHGKRYQWPPIKKAQRLGAHLVFLEESGFLLLPTRRRTWGPTGQTPVVHYNTTTGTTVFPPWPPSVCQPSANTWVCISGSSRTTSQRLMWLGFSVHSYDTCGGQSSSCGTTDESTRDRSLPNCGGTIPASTLNRSPATLLNSIPLNRYGMTSRATPPTVCFKTSGISASDSTPMHGVCVARKPNSDRSSWPPISHRRPGSGCITYAKRYNRREHSSIVRLAAENVGDP